MKTSALTTALISLLLTTLISATPLPRFPSDCVCVTSPCPCDGSEAGDTFKVRRSALPLPLPLPAPFPPGGSPSCPNGPDGGCQDTNGNLKRSSSGMGQLEAREDPVEYCNRNPDICRAIAKKYESEQRKRAVTLEEREAMRDDDPLKNCLDHWEACKEALGSF